MTPPPGFIEQLVGWFGPAGAAFAVVSMVLGYFYRRDFLRKTNDRRELIEAFTKNAASQAKLATVLDGFAKKLDDHEERQRETLQGVGTKVEHALNAGFHTILLELRAERR